MCEAAGRQVFEPLQRKRDFSELCASEFQLSKPMHWQSACKQGTVFASERAVLSASIPSNPRFHTWQNDAKCQEKADRNGTNTSDGTDGGLDGGLAMTKTYHVSFHLSLRSGRCGMFEKTKQNIRTSAVQNVFR